MIHTRRALMRDAGFILIRTAGLNLIPSRGHPPEAGEEVFVLRPPRRTALPSAHTVRWRQGVPCGAEGGGSGREGAAVLHPSQTRPRSGGAGGARSWGRGLGAGLKLRGPTPSSLRAASLPPRAAPALLS